ncbi:hypothetical protein C8J56DRAFT_20576 [Mycena floridula]|nr:hypothetical protein C8J56DRAFT_20576 [Mycena floridula]
MSRKRTSLQSLGLFMPGLFLTSTVEDPPKSPVKPHTSLFHTWGHSSTSPWRSTPSPPPDFLLDEDPFANLAAGPGATEPSPVSPVSPSSAVPIPSAVPAPVSPRSPLAAEFDHPPTAPVRTVTTQARSATQKPAFQPRPSLPSLRVLAETNFVVPHRIRRGRVGAGLPAEPWDFPPPSPSPAPEVHTSTSVSADDIEMDFLDFSSDEVQSLDSLDMTFMSSSESLILPEPQFSSHDQGRL